MSDYVERLTAMESSGPVDVSGLRRGGARIRHFRRRVLRRSSAVSVVAFGSVVVLDVLQSPLPRWTIAGLLALTLTVPLLRLFPERPIGWSAYVGGAAVAAAFAVWSIPNVPLGTSFGVLAYGTSLEAAVRAIHQGPRVDGPAGRYPSVVLATVRAGAATVLVCVATTWLVSTGSAATALLATFAAGIGLLCLGTEFRRIGTVLLRKPSGDHAIVVPPGDPVVLGGTRSAIESWAATDLRVEVLTQAGSRAADIAKAHGLATVSVWAPDPGRCGRLHRAIVAAAWLLWFGPKLHRYETVEIEANHAAEILPSALAHGAALVLSFRDFPKRHSRAKLWVWSRGHAVYAINRELASWLQEVTGRSDVMTSWIPVLGDEQHVDLTPACGGKSGERAEILIVGSITRRKGQRELCQMATERFPDSWGVRVIGVAGGDERYVADVERLARDHPGRIWLTGHLERWWDEVPPGSVVAINSVSEGGPRVAVEALSNGIPVVMRRFRGHSCFEGIPMIWIVEDGPESWVSAVHEALSYRPTDAQRSQLEKVLGRYRRSAVARRLTDLWRGNVDVAQAVPQ